MLAPYKQVRRADSLVACMQVQKLSGPASVPTGGLHDVVSQFKACQDTKQRYKLLLQLAAEMSPMSESSKTAANRVMGCTAQVIITFELERLSLAYHSHQPI